ncbi:hypothetical protein JCM11491_003721 [Sporobolomyces phaffii]
MLFGQIPFLPLVDGECTPELTAALARIVPLLVPSSLAAATVPSLPPTAEYYVLDDTHASVEDAIAFLDRGATRIVSKNARLLAQVPAERLVLHLDGSSRDASILASADLVASVSGVLLETTDFAESHLEPYRAALKRNAQPDRRPLDLFVLCASRDRTQTLAQPAALKLVAKSVAATSVLATSVLSATVGNLSAPHPEDDGTLSVATLYTTALRTDRQDGLFVTVPVSLASVPTALGVVYSSGESIARSIVSGNATYYSRSRQGLWEKGLTSGAMQRVERIRYDCDCDAVEFGVVESGPKGEQEGFCHVPEQQSCFGGVTGLADLEATLKERMRAAPAGSYTKRLFSEPQLLRAKIMEEAGEVCDAATPEDLAGEVADLVYFTLTRAVSMGVSLKDVQRVLDRRSLKVTRRKGDAKPEWIDKLGLDADQAVGVAGEK